MATEQPSPAPPARGAALACPCCHSEEVPLLPGRTLDAEVAAVAIANARGWHPDQPLCLECVQRFADALGQLRRRPDWRGSPILATPLRLGADPGLTGEGVTIAFLDSGFYAHPDLTEGEPGQRILRYVDVTRPGARIDELKRPDVSSWHGMMTSVVACGNGHLSDGFYRGLASRANLVLVKVGSARRIAHDDIRKGLDWVIRNRRRYGIRVVNVSCGGDYEASYLSDPLSQSAERAAREGLLVVAAAGNAGLHPRHPVVPPASAPSVLAVGGLDDKNRSEFAGYEMYHSSYGPTLDGLQKPELLAPGIWVAAPILPGTPTAGQAELLARLQAAREDELRSLLQASPGVDEQLDAAIGLEPYLIRQLVEIRARDQNVISGSYKHVDGTSFSAPIVASLAAQLFEACPALDAREVRRVLIETARRLSHVPVERQGFGVVDARRAVAEARQRCPQKTEGA